MIKKPNGFTLIEILIAIIIIGVIAGLAVPAYQSSVQRSYQMEALQVLSTLRASMMRYYSTKGAFSGATIWTGVCTLDYCPHNVDTSGQVMHFSYSMNVRATKAQMVAQRTAVDGGDGSTIVVDESGKIYKTGIYGNDVVPDIDA